MELEIGKFENIKYVIRYPEDYCEGREFPVLFYLPGAGSRGNDINIVKNSLFFKLIDKHENFPFITIALQCSENTWFDMFEQLKKFICKMAAESFTDIRRIYLMGTSMGGYGAWQLAMSMPELFAAIVPICGGGMYWNANRLVNVPVWAFHGGKDTIVFKEESIKMVEAVNKCGGKAKLTIYPENGHNAWSDTFANPEVFNWLLSNKNKNDLELIDRYKDSDIYG